MYVEEWNIFQHTECTQSCTYHFISLWTYFNAKKNTQKNTRAKKAHRNSQNVQQIFPPSRTTQNIIVTNTTTSHAYLRSDSDELVDQIDCCSFSSLDISQNYLPKYFCTSLEGVVVVLAAGYAWPRG